MVAFGGMAGGAWLFGTLAEDHGVLVALYGAAAVQFASALIGYVRPLVQTGEQNLDLQNLWREPQTTVPIEPRSGQIGRDTSELQSLMRISYAVFCLKKKKTKKENNQDHK